MIAGLRGAIKEKAPEGVVVDVHGVYYYCSISLNTFSAIGEIGDEVELFTYTHVREDVLQLFGFSEIMERTLFLHLIGVNGIGPKLALNILSGSGAERLGEAIVNGDIAALTGVPGIGKKTAERILIELKEKVAKAFAIEPTKQTPKKKQLKHENELTSGLINMGFKPKAVEKVVQKLGNEMPEDTSVQDLIRAALKEITG